ncbi:hypothetical protein G6F42_007815 [Rhizopus arrhizus]|nr:hypothetical protein G6F42_007815 [Rhizopus arrhizus]
MKGLLYLKQLSDERCQISFFNAKNVSGYLSFATAYVRYFKSLYSQFNNVNDTNLSVPGKPSVQLIAAMSHLYKENSTTKYFTKSPLVNELLIESMLAKDIFTISSAIGNTDFIWIYVHLVLLIMYPFVHECALSSYRSIEDYLFDGGSTRISNDVYIHESTTENESTKASAPKEPTATARAASRRSSLASSIGSIHLDYTNAVAHNWTGEELLAEESKLHLPAKAPFELSKSQRFWSGSQPANSDPFAFPDSQSDSSLHVGGGNGFQFPTAPGGPSNAGSSLTQHGAPGNLNTTIDPEPPNPSENLVHPPDSASSAHSTFSKMSFVPPTASVSEKFPEFAKDNTSNPPLNLPSVFSGPSNVASTSNPVVPIKPAGFSNPSVVSTLSKYTRTVGPSGIAQMPPESDEDSSFDGHITPPEHPKFARRSLSHADQLAHFAAQKQSVNDFADQLGAFLEKMASVEVPKSNTASNSKPQASTTSVKPPDPKKIPFNGTNDPMKAQAGQTSSEKKTSSTRDSKPNLAPPPPQYSSLTEEVEYPPFMPRRKEQPTASTTAKLSFSRFKSGSDGSPTDSSSFAGPLLPHQNRPSYTPDSSRSSTPPSSSPTTDSYKKQGSPKPHYSYPPGSLHSLIVSASQVKSAPLFTSSFKHLRGPSGVQTLADVSAKPNRGATSSNTKTSMDAASSTASMASTTVRPDSSAPPTSMTDNQSAFNTDHRSLEKELTLNLSDENFFATATSLNYDPSSNIPPTKSNNKNDI